MREAVSIRSRKPPLGSMTVTAHLPWLPKKRALVKAVVIGRGPKESIRLKVWRRKKGPTGFRIDAEPKSILPDTLASYQCETDYATLAEAIRVSEQIAQRALVH